MSEFHTLHLAVEVASRRRDALARDHAQCLRAQERAREQMQQLQSYGEDSDLAWADHMLSVSSAHLLQYRSQFMGRLQYAVEVQQQALEEQARQVQAAAARLLQAEFKLAGLRQVLHARQATAAVRLQRREQRQTDEMAALRHLHHRGSYSLTDSRSDPHGH